MCADEMLVPLTSAHTLVVSSSNANVKDRFALVSMCTLSCSIRFDPLS